MVRAVWVGVGLLAASMGCSALSLGAVQGQALIGRPLDVSISLTLGDGESVSDACASAQVFFADDLVSVTGVKAAVVPGAQRNTATVRVQTTAPVTETFARIELQVGCGQRITRSYVLLADLTPVEQTSPVPGKALQPAVANPAGLAVARSSTPDAPPPAAAKRQAEKPVDGAPGTLVVGPRKPKPSSATARTSAPATPGVPPAQGARLTLDPVELVAAANQMQPSLRLSVDAPVESVENEGLVQRRQAARLLWQVLNESPDQLAANALKAQVTDAEAARINAELAQAQQLAQAAQAQLLEEQDGRYTHPAFLGLLAAFLAALGGLAVLLRRQRSGDSQEVPPWWKKASTQPEAEPQVPHDAAPKAGLFERFKRLRKPVKGGHRGLRGDPPLDIDVGTLMPEDAWPAASGPLAAVPLNEAGSTQPHTDFTHSAIFEGTRAVATEELFDLQQQVEFFISLGQADQAIEVLKAHLSDSGEVSPLAYLDLLKIYHEVGQRDDYAALQARFNNTFNGNAPDFDRYSFSRRGLERYESALSRIQSLWPQPAVLKLIERSIFRATPEEASEVFDLEAYRELLLLYGIAREVIESQSGDMASKHVTLNGPPKREVDFAAETSMQSLPVKMAPALTGSARETEPEAEASFDALLRDLASAVGEEDHEKTVFATDGELVASDAFSGTGLELDLDLSVGDEPSQNAAATAVLPTAVAPPNDEAKDSTPKATQSSGPGHVLDLDFSALGEPEVFTIKKSGKPD